MNKHQQILRLRNNLNTRFHLPISGGKGDSTAQGAEQLQLQMNQQLMGMFQTQFGKQSQITDFLTQKMTPFLTNPTGYAPDALAAMRTQASEQNSTAFNNSIRDFQQRSFINGGRDLPSGVNSQVLGALETEQAQNEANSQRDITLQNANLANQNFFNAASVLSGNAAMLNPLGYAGATSAGTDSIANASQAVTASQQSGLLNGIIGGLTGAGSALLGNPALFKKP